VTQQLGAPLLSAQEVAKYAGVSLRLVRTWLASGALPAVRFSKRCLRVKPEDLAKFIAERTAGAQAKGRRS